MKKISWLFLFLGIIILAVSACSLKKDEVKQTENITEETVTPKKENITDKLLKVKEMCGAEPTKISTLKVGDFYKTHKIKEISGNFLNNNCETLCTAIVSDYDSVNGKVLFDGEETISGTLVMNDQYSLFTFVPDDKTWTPIFLNIYLENQNAAIVKGLSCADAFGLDTSRDNQALAKLPGVDKFLNEAKTGDNYPEKVSITIKNLRTSFLFGGEGGTSAELVDIKLLSNKSDFKTYINKELGISFNYPKAWPEPVFVKNAGLTGGMFDVNGQWELELGDLHKNSLEGADKYFASLRGVYTQSRSDILKKIKADEKEGSAKLIKETDSYIVYNEAGIVGVKNIMIFGKDKTIRIQSLGDILDSEIDSIADSLSFN